jgi:hypothetical protein
MNVFSDGAPRRGRGQDAAVDLPATCAMPAQALPRIYYLHPHMAGPLDHWPMHLDRICAMGFAQLLVAWPFAADAGDIFATHDIDRPHPALGHNGPLELAFRSLARMCQERGLQCLVDLVVDRAAADGVLAASLPGCWQQTGLPWIDPRTIASTKIVHADFDASDARDRLVPYWQERLVQWQSWGIAGVRCHAAHVVPLAVWRDILAPVRTADPAWCAIGWMVGRPRQQLIAASEVFDCIPSSAAWWDGRAPWLVEEYRAVAPATRLLAFPDDPFGRRLAARVRPGQALASHRLALQAASALADGWLVPMGFEYCAHENFLLPRCDAEDFALLAADAALDLSAEIAAANAGMSHLAAASGGMMRVLSADGAPATLIHRDAGAKRGVLVLLNPDLGRPVTVHVGATVAGIGMEVVDDGTCIDLPPGAGAIVPTEPSAPIVGVPEPRAVLADMADQPRIAIEAISPAVDHGRFAVKHGTFDDVIARLPAIRDMGFDVLYFPPIHPIGRTNRKGRNNALTAEPEIPAAPMRSARRGRPRRDPSRSSARSRISAGCATPRRTDIWKSRSISPSSARPTIPGCASIPNGSSWRPDGTMRYAENPPKKYEDIVNVDFYAEARFPALWLALARRRAVLGRQGVRIFRVDNPHTKPLPFWEWLIADIRAAIPT